MYYSNMARTNRSSNQFDGIEDLTNSMAGRNDARLPSGFRFCPTDEELVMHYLHCRALASPLPAAVDILDIRLLTHDPSELLPPGWSEQERYFFICKEAKYVKGRRVNLATGAGSPLPFY